MGVASRIAVYLYREVGMSRSQLDAILDEMDTDLDGKISLAELAAYLRVAWAEARAARRAVDKEVAARTRTAKKRLRR